MRMEHPLALLLLILLIPYAVLSAVRMRKNRASVEALSPADSSKSLSVRYAARAFYDSLFFALFWISIVLSLAGISWGERTVRESSSGTEVALCLDVSRSMLARDSPPSRLAQASSFSRKLMRECAGAAFSLTVFKGEAFAIFPMTEDLDAIDAFLDAAGPGLATAKGTDLGKGIGEALSTFSASPRKRILIVLSDGESVASAAKAASEARARGVRVDAIGFGTRDGATIPLDKDVLRDSEGRPIRTALSAGRLQTLASEGGGRFFLAEDPQAMKYFKEESMLATPGPASYRLARERIERKRLFLVLSGICLLARFLVGLRIFKPELPGAREAAIGK